MGLMAGQHCSERHRPASVPDMEITAPPSPALTMHELVTAYFEIVWRWVRAFGVLADDADDATQQVFLIASRKLGAIEAGRERSFLFGTARGVASNYRRIAKRRPAVADEAEVVALLDHAPNPEETLDDRQARAVLEHVLSLLADDLRDVFVLFELDEMSTAEISAVLDVPIGTVASRLRRARQEFRDVVARLRARRVRTEGGVGS